MALLFPLYVKYRESWPRRPPSLEACRFGVRWRPISYGRLVVLPARVASEPFGDFEVPLCAPADEVRQMPERPGERQDAQGDRCDVHAVPFG